MAEEDPFYVRDTIAMLRPYPEDGPWAGRISKMRILKAQIEENAPPIMGVAPPRSITQEQEQADLKARLGREELVDIDKRNALVKVKDSVSEPTSRRRRSNGMWLLVLVALVAAAALLADRFHLL